MIKLIEKENWEWKPLKYIFNYSLSSVDRKIEEEEINVHICHYPDVYKNEKISNKDNLNMGTCTKLQLENFELKKGDIIITKDSEDPKDIGIPCFIENDLTHSVCGYHLGILRTKENIEKEFYFRYIQSTDVKDYFFCESNGITRFGLGKSSVENLKIPVLSIKEQKIIAQYLDQKTSQIDALIEKLDKKIELLKEQKIVLINQYVTKGLDLNVEMKDSGIKCIGKIPKHWSLKKISHIVNFIGSGTTPKSNMKEYYENGKENWLITGDLNDNEIYETTKKITAKALEDTSLKTYPQNSLVIAMYGATIGKLGILKVKSTVNQACCVLNFDTQQDVDFWFNSFIGNREYLISLGYGGGQPNISQETIRGLRLPSPPNKSEQILISKILKTKSKKINDLIKKHIKKKNLLREYRQSLISSVVTGKIRITEEMI